MCSTLCARLSCTHKDLTPPTALCGTGTSLTHKELSTALGGIIMSQRQIPARSLRLFPPLLLLLGAGQQCLTVRPLLLFLIDGFRYDYMDDLDALPGFREIVGNGVKVDYMTPDFPSLSYPNYYSLMTGNQSINLSATNLQY